MKTWLHSTCIAALLLWAACPLRAETVLLEETFDGPVGTPLNGWHGWSGDEGVVISRIIIDKGHSASWAGDGQFPGVSKTFSPTIQNGSVYVLTATLSAFDANGSYADVRLATSGVKKASHVGVAAGYRDLVFEQNAPADGPIVRTPQTAETMDVRMVVSDDSIACYHRNHGEATWILDGTLKAQNRLSAYNTIIVAGGTSPGRSRGGGIDSIRLTVEPRGSTKDRSP
jgi:hypothetical protein